MKPIPITTRFFLSLFTVLGLVACGGGGGGGGTGPTPGNDRTEEFPSGGEIVFPEGALPEGAAVTITAASTPTLPLGIDPVGSAVSIELEQALTRPASIRVPIPPGVDPGDFVLIQVEDDGTPILLSGVLDGNDYVAATPGFGTSSVPRKVDRVDSNRGRVMGGVLGEILGDPSQPPGLSPPLAKQIEGPQIIPLLDPAIYVLSPNTDLVEAPQWSVVGPAVLTEAEGTTLASVTAESEGRIDLMADFISAASGTPGFAAFRISAQEGDLMPLGYLTQTVPRFPVAGRELTMSAAPSHFSPVRWTWDFGDGSPNATGGKPNTEFRFKQSYIYEQPGTFTATVSAFDADDREITSSTTRTVQAQPQLRLAPVQFRTEIQSPGGPFTYQVLLIDEVPPLEATWSLFPGSSFPTQPVTGDFNDQLISFDQPGTFYVSVTVEETGGEGQSATLTMQTTVKGAAAISPTLDLQISEPPTVGSTVTGQLSVSGGILIANGLKQDYVVDVNWGDAVQTLTLPASSPDAGASIAVSHTYTQSGDFGVYAEAADATGDRRNSPVTDVEVTPADVTVTENFVLFQGDGTCQFSAAPVTTGQLRIDLDMVNRVAVLRVQASGSGTRQDLRCPPDPSTADMVWNSAYDNEESPATGTFTLEGDVASFTVSGTLSGEGSFFWTDCRDGEEPESCPPPGGGAFTVPATFTGTVNTVAGTSSGTVVVNTGLPTSGSWGD